MMFDQLCVQCGASDFHRSRVNSAFGMLTAVILTPYRCNVCGWRQDKLRFVAMPAEKASEDANEVPLDARKRAAPH